MPNMPKEEISLNARWELACFEPGEGLKEGAHLPKTVLADSIDAVVPGDVHLDLMRAGRIADPFVGLNHFESRWVAEKEWWYRREFSVHERLRGMQLELQFAGLDTFASVWVNGRHAGKHHNMFTRCTLDITGLVHYGHRNTVAVCIEPPVAAVESKTIEGLGVVFETPERLHARKAQMSYGWDIAPRILTAGIWRPVTLVALGKVAVGTPAVSTASIGEDEAEVHVEIPLKAIDSPTDCELQVEVAANRGGTLVASRTISVHAAKAGKIVKTSFKIRNPSLWWPWNVGRPDLYRLIVKAVVQGQVEDDFRTRFGIRTVELVREPVGDGGESFVFAVNGRKIFAKGMNWTPGDAIFARMTRKKYRELVDSALEANANMLRIWGGGIYEDPYFYRLCDEHGIMVWQDFMFSCADYPRDEAFLAEVRQEAEHVVESLRNHPSIVLWCGDNEVDVTRKAWGLRIEDNALNRQVLPEACDRLDSTRPYICSSPCGLDPNSALEGDFHNWHHGLSYTDRAYSEDYCRFASEIGHLSLPWAESIKRFISPEETWPPQGRSWDFHFGTLEGADPRRREKLDQAIAHLGFDPPQSLAEYAYQSQFVQALACKEWMEHYRRRKFSCGGSLYWNLHDCWPQFSDSLVDYYGSPKMAYYFLKRAFANLLVSLQPLDRWRVGVWLINDELRGRAGRLMLRCQRLDGGTSWMRVLPVKLPANSSRLVWHMRLPRPLMEESDTCFTQAQLLINGRVVSEDFRFPAEFSRINWPKTQLTPKLNSCLEERRCHRIDLTIGSSAYARLVRIETPGRESEIGNNFFDVPPGEERSVRILVEQGPGPITVRFSAANADALEINPEVGD